VYSDKTAASQSRSGGETQCGQREDNGSTSKSDDYHYLDDDDDADTTGRTGKRASRRARQRYDIHVRGRGQSLDRQRAGRRRFVIRVHDRADTTDNLVHRRDVMITE